MDVQVFAHAFSCTRGKAEREPWREKKYLISPDPIVPGTMSSLAPVWLPGLPCRLSSRLPAAQQPQRLSAALLFSIFIPFLTHGYQGLKQSMRILGTMCLGLLLLTDY